MLGYKMWKYGLLLLLLCSVSASCAEVLISPASQWRYYDLAEPLGEKWFSPAYDDKDWPVGHGQFGYGEGDESTVTGFGDDPNNKPLVQYFRRTFNITDLTLLSAIKLRLLVDDGAIIYINGEPVHRVNLPQQIKPGTRATHSLIESVWIEVAVDKGLFKTGPNTIAVAVYQISKASSDLSFDLALLSQKRLMTKN